MSPVTVNKQAFPPEETLLEAGAYLLCTCYRTWPRTPGSAVTSEKALRKQETVKGLGTFTCPRCGSNLTQRTKSDRRMNESMSFPHGCSKKAYHSKNFA